MLTACGSAACTDGVTGPGATGVSGDAASPDAEVPDVGAPDDAGPVEVDAAEAPALDASGPPAMDDARVPATDAGSDGGQGPVPDAAVSPVPDAAISPTLDVGVVSTPDVAVAPVSDAAVGPTPDAAVVVPAADAAVVPTPDAAIVAPSDAAIVPAPDAAVVPAPDAAVEPTPDAAVPPPVPYVPTCDLVVNGGAETGDLAGWVVEQGEFESRAEQLLSIPRPPTGQRLFFAGQAERSRLHQDVDARPYGILADEGTLYASLTAQVRTWSGDDRAGLELHALDADGNPLGGVTSDLFADADWTVRQLGLDVPAGTASLRVVLVGERRAGQDNDAYFDDVLLCLSTAPPPPPVADARVPPYLMWATTDGASVLWETESPARGFVDVGGLRFEEAGEHTLHEIRMTGLDPDTEYVYVVGQEAQAFPPATFRTAPEGASPFDFIVFGDNQNGPETFGRLVDYMVDEAPAWAASVGDCVQWGLADLYRSEFLRPIHPLASAAPFLVAAGNHERLIDFGGNLFNQYMAQPGDEHCFGYRYGEAFFLFLDTENSVDEGSAQYACAQAALNSEAAQTATLRAALFHKPPRVEYWAGFCYTGEADVRESLTPLFAEHGVDIVFNGHNHLYAYTPPGPDGITWVTTGGGGGAIDGPNSFCRQWDEITETQFVHHFLSVHVEAGRMLVRAIDEDGAELHRFEVPAGP